MGGQGDNLRLNRIIEEVNAGSMGGLRRREDSTNEFAGGPSKRSRTEGPSALEFMMDCMKAQKDGWEAIKSMIQPRTEERTEVTQEEGNIKAEKPKMIEMMNYDLKDDAHMTIDYEVRTKLRPINAKPEVWWKRFPRVSRPVLENIEIDYLDKTPVNPLVVKRLHDQGAVIKIKMLLPDNLSVEDRNVKATFTAQGGSLVGALNYSWIEPQTAWQIMDAAIHLLCLLHRIRPEDHRAITLLKVRA